MIISVLPRQGRKFCQWARCPIMFCLLAMVPGIFAQEPREGDKVDWHIVQAGETLEIITEKYLGDKDLWPENKRLNPAIRDPDKLRIGQKIKVITFRKLPPRTAEVSVIKRKVERQPEQAPWVSAKIGDRLKERHAIRTLKQSSAELSFDDGTQLQISEQSMVFLRTVGQSLRGVTRQSVELIAGQADVGTTSKRRRTPDIEVVMGTMVAKPKPGNSGYLAMRNRVNPDGNAQVMVYKGNSDVNSSGQTVAVPKGMGVTVEPGKAPPPPEKLLPAPRLDVPKNKTSLAYTNPTLSWKPLSGADRYKLEVCEDQGCKRPLRKVHGLQQTQWSADDLPASPIYWRVTAVKASGLDGYPSSSRSLILAGEPDRQPPAVILYPVGPSHVDENGNVFMGSGSRLKLEAKDQGSGVAQIRYRWDGGDWITYKGKSLRFKNGADRRSFEFQASDRLGQWSPVHKTEVQKQTAAPEAPFANPEAP